VQRWLALGSLALCVCAAAGFGYWLGLRTGELDRSYLSSLEIKERVNAERIRTLQRELADVNLAQTIDAQAAQSLRQSLSAMRDQLAGLEEEVIFYKSLMAPSSLERGLQIADFTVVPGDAANQFRYRLLLTQTEARRDWIEGGIQLQIRGARTRADGQASEEVLSLTELEELEAYPLRFRFRYFQDLSGSLILPEGFSPQEVSITATPKGKRVEASERSFDWAIQAG